jgi:hypothetical protein
MRSSAYEQQESDLKHRKKDRKQNDEKIKKTAGNHSGHGFSQHIIPYACAGKQRC